MEPNPPARRDAAPFGPPTAGAGLPVLPGLSARLAAAAGRGDPEPVGGGPEILDAACGYWSRRGLRTDPYHVLATGGAEGLLLALLAAVRGDVLVARPCAPWHTAQALLLGRPAYPVAIPAECGGVPDAYALLETVRRIREEGGDPRLLVLSVADDPTGTVAPPDLLYETCEAAAEQGLLIVSDETYRDTLHPPGVTGVTGVPGVSGVPGVPGDGRAEGGPATGTGAPGPGAGTAVVSPAEMLPEYVVVIAGLSAVLLPHGWPAAVARFPGTWRGAELHAATLDVLAGTGGALPAPFAAVAAQALAEPPAVEERVRAAARLHGVLAAALHRTVTAHGALCRPPRAGSHLYPDLDPLRPALAASGVTDSVELEEELTRRLGRPVPGGHRFGDPPDALRVRLSTDMLLGASDAERLRELTAVDPLGSPPAAEALRLVEAAFGAWSGGRAGE